jgi:alkanesulfonate monooxygenase
LYFGGYSPPALDLCGAHCDVYLMWPEAEADIALRMKAAHERAAHHGRVLDYGLRVHMIVRDTEQEAREYATELVSMLDDEEGRKIRERALDAKTYGVAIQAKNRSGCGAALVGSVDQVMGKIERYQKMGIRAFIFSGYPHLSECEIFGSKVLPQLKTCSLPQVYGRTPRDTPATPLGNGTRR